MESIAANTWSHVSIARKGAALYLYVNGKVQAVNNIGTNPLINSNARFSVGGNIINNTNYYDGGVDDIAIYKSYLTERKIKYNLDKGLVGDPVVP